MRGCSAESEALSGEWQITAAWPGLNEWHNLLIMKADWSISYRVTELSFIFSMASIFSETLNNVRILPITKLLYPLVL